MPIEEDWLMSTWNCSIWYGHLPHRMEIAIQHCGSW